MRWGLNKFKAEEKEWCQSQISLNASGSNHYYYFTCNKNLITPTGSFVALILSCEKKYTKQRNIAAVLLDAIIGVLREEQKNLRKLSSTCMKAATRLLQRYIRLRCHIACSHKLHLHKAVLKSCALRRSLKDRTGTSQF